MKVAAVRLLCAFAIGFVVQPLTTEAARALGLEIAPGILIHAGELIE
jgi:hypothetical protein